MAIVTQKLDLRHYSNGQDQKDYYQKSATVAQSAGLESTVYEVAVKVNLTVHFTNGTLHESIGSKEEVEAETAYWTLLGSSASTVVLNPGYKFIKVINDGVGASVFNVSGM